MFEGLRRALGTAAALRYEVGLEFVVVSSQPATAGSCAGLMTATPSVSSPSWPAVPAGSAPIPMRGSVGRRWTWSPRCIGPPRPCGAARPTTSPASGAGADLDAFLRDPDRRWEGGPFSEAARQLLATRTADLAQLTTGFDQLAGGTLAARADPVITHGEPHPANLMSVDGRLVLIDWDTAALARPERDVALIATTGDQGIDRYQRATGRELDPAAITLYRLRWYLDDLASAIRMFRHPHRDTPETRRWWRGLAPRLGQLSQWLDHLD